MSETPLRAAIAKALASEPEVPAAMLARLAGGQRPRPQDVASLTNKARGALRSQAVAKLRAQAVLAAAATVREQVGYVPVTLPSGEVLEVESVEPAPMYPDGEAVQIRPRGAPVNGDGDLIIVNPPTLVPHYAGEILVDGVPHREDPLGALAVVIQRAYGRGN